MPNVIVHRVMSLIVRRKWNLLYFSTSKSEITKDFGENKCPCNLSCILEKHPKVYLYVLISIRILKLKPLWLEYVLLITTVVIIDGSHISIQFESRVRPGGQDNWGHLRHIFYRSENIGYWVLAVHCMWLQERSVRSCCLSLKYLSFVGS